MSASRPLIVLLAAASLSACSTVSSIGSAIWPFDGGPSKAPDDTKDGRISILTFEQKLEAEPGLAGTLILPEPKTLAQWAQPGGDVTNAPGSIAGAAEPKILWRRGVGGESTAQSRYASTPVIAGGTLYVLSIGQTVRAFDAASGNPKWSRRLKSDKPRDKVAQGGGLAFADQRVFVTSGFGFIAALDSESGKEIWRTPTNAPFSSAPTVLDGRVFASTNDSELLAFDAETGRVLWNYQAIAEPARVLSSSSPAVTQDAVVAPFASGEIVALSPGNGRRLWVDALTRSGRLTSLSSINDVAGRPAVVDGTVYAVSHSGVLASVDLRSGQRVWAKGLASTQTPYVVGDVAFVVSTDSELVAFHRRDGNIYWTEQLQRYTNTKKSKGRVTWAGPILFGGHLVAASSQGDMVFVNPENGEVVKTLDIKAPVFVPPVAANGILYVLTNSGRLIALQ